jgi:dienelactone hydrolase
MDEKCCTPGPPARDHPSGGYEEKRFGLDCYFNWPAGATKAVVMVADVFGYQKPLLRKFADKIADEGFVAIIPDYFRGDYIDAPQYKEDRNSWFGKHPFEPVIEETLTVIQGLKKEKGITSVGMAGFCYGGKIGSVVATKGTADAVVIMHPAKVVVDDIKKVNTPLAVLSAEHDKLTTVSDVKEWDGILSSKGNYFSKIYPGVDHGWTVRYDENDEQAVKIAYEAQADCISWFKKHLQ